MANNKKFIVKNGLLTQENVVIGTVTDNGVDKLQVTGSTTLSGTAEITQSTPASASLNITNSGGFAANSIITQFSGNADSLRVINFENGAYELTNSGQNNGVRFYNDSDGLEIVYNNSVDLEFSSAGIDFKREPRYNGDVFWNAGNDGANSGLDADLLDGLDSLQFLRSDQDDIMNGSLVITGDLTVSGNTTYVNTEEILLSDNIITLNANYTGSTPSENAGIEVERGTLDKASFVWNETTDKWELSGPSQGLVLGDSTSLVGDITSYANSFIIQAGGATGVSDGTVYLTGRLNGDETHSGVAAFYNQGTGVSYGELRYNGTPKIRTENNGAVTIGNQRILGAATIGTGSGGAYIYMDGAGNNGTIYSSAGEIGFLNASFNYALKVDSSGDVRVTDDLYAPRLIDADNNSFILDPDGTSTLNDISLVGEIIHNGDTDTYIGFPAADQFEVRTGGSQRLLVTNTGVTSTVDIIAPRFLDSDDNSYLADPASASVFNTLGLDSDLFHNGDADTKISFGTDEITLATAGSVRLTANTSAVTSTLDVYAPRYYDTDDNAYYLDPNSLSQLHSANFYSGTANNTINIGTDVDERIEITTTPSQAYFRYYQDETNNTNHSVNFEIISSGVGLNRFNFNKEINAGTNSIVGGLGAFSTSVYAPIYYDYDDETYYADFNNTDVSIKAAGEIIAGNGSAATPTYSFVNDPNTGMFRGNADRLDFSAGGNVELQVFSTYALAPGSFRAPIFYDSNNTSYYGDFASTSVMNNIGIDSDLFHNGDTDTYLRFGTNTITLTSGNVARLALTTTEATFANNVYAPRFYTNDYLVHQGDENTYIGFNANDTFGVWTNNANRLSITNTAITGSVNFVGPRFVDSDDNAYYAEPASTSVFNTLGINSDLFHNGDTDTKINFTTDTIKLDTGGATRLTANNSGVYVDDIYASNFFGTTQASAPIFYDSDNIAYYADFANTDISIVTAGKIGVGTVSPGAMVDINIPTAMGPNPYAAGNQYAKFGDAGTTDFSIAGDNLRDVYFVQNADGNINFADSGANIRLGIDTGTGDVVVGDAAATYTSTDNTSVIDGPTPGTPRTITNNLFHVNGSIQLNGNNDAIVFGRGTSTFLMDEELGFGWGGGFYMTEATTVRIRNDKNLSTGGNMTAANMYAARFYDSNDNNYYVDPNGDSQMNTIDIDDYIRHRGDTNTYMGFDAADGITLVTGGTERMNLDNDSADFSVNVYAPRYYDSNNNAYYGDFASTSQMNRIDIDDYIRHRGDTNTYIGFDAADRFRVWTGGGNRLSIDNDSADFSVNVYAPRYYDSNNSAFFGDFASRSNLNALTVNVQNTNDTTNADVQGLIMYGNYTNGQYAHRFRKFDHGGGVPLYVDGSGGTAHVFSRLARFGTYTGNPYHFEVFGNSAATDMYANRYYDRNNTAFYMDPGSTSLTNTMRANRYQVRGSTYFIDESSSTYGSIRVEGQKNGWAGYAIYDDWVFMSNGSANAGIYNDTRNEWALYAQDNNFTRLYANGVHQIGAENGYGFAPSNMRSPIFYDSNDTNYFGDFASRSRMQTLSLGNQGDLSANNTYALRIWHNNRYVIGMRNSGADANYPWLFHDNKDGVSAWGVHFNGIADRFWVKETGDANLEGEMQAENFLIGTGNEPIGIIKTYGSGLADTVLFDGTEYWEKRTLKSHQGAENNATTNTAEYVKNNNGPFASTHALRTSAYRTFDSDYIPVEPGEEIYGEIAVRYISGSGGALYMGVRRYDKDKRAIAGNDGIEYFVVGGANVTSTGWTTYRGHHTIPTSHTPFNGSDGGACKYVRLIVLMNYSSGGALREFGPPILKRTNVQSRIRTDQNVYAPIYYDSDDNGYYLNPNSISILNDVRASIYYDRNNTARFMNPNSGGNVQGTWNWNNGTIDNLNNLTFNDPGPSEGIRWKGGNLWQIYESPNNLSTNSGGNLQITSGSGNGTFRARIDINGDVWAGRYMYAQRFYDSNNTGYYLDPASSGTAAVLRGRIQINGDDNDTWMDMKSASNGYGRIRIGAYAGDPFIEFSDASNSAGQDQVWAIGADDREVGSFVIRWGGSNLFPADWTSAGTERFQLKSNGNLSLSGGEPNSYRLTIGGTGYASSDFRAPIFYDVNNTAYYGNFASTSLMNYVRVNRLEFGGSGQYMDRAVGNYGTVKVEGVSGSSGTWAGYAIRDDWVFMSDGATNAGIYNDTDNEWALLAQRNSDVQIYYNGTWEERSRSGYMQARGSYRAPIFYDSNNTTYRIDGNGTSRLLTLQVDNVIQGNINGYSEYLLRRDNRIIAPNEDASGRLRFGFTSWANNNSAPYADYLHLRSYTDSSGGSDNLVMFKKSGIGMRIWQQSWNSSSAYSTARNVAIYNENPDGSSNYLYADVYYDENNTGRYVQPAGTTSIDRLNINGGNPIYFYTSSGNLRGYICATESNDNHFEFATSGGEDIIFRDGGFGGSYNLLIRGDGNVFASSSMRAPIFYDSNNTAYYGNFASTSVFNTIDNRGEIYNDGWFRNDTNGRGLYNTATAMHWYSDSSERWRLYSTSNTAQILFTTSGNNARGYVYANNSNEIGFLNQSGSWNLRTNSSVVDSYRNFYAPIFYDRDNSAYYSNPASTSRFNNVRANYFTNDGGASSNDGFGLYWDSGRSSAYAIYREPGGWSFPYPDLRIAFHTGIKFGANASYQGMRFYNDYTMAGQVMSINNANDPLGGNNVYVNSNLQAGSSLRAPIFYDSNNTSYYFNGASTNASRFLGVNNQTMAYMALPGHTRNSGEYYRARPRQTSDTNYWTGSMGWGRNDMNVVSTWGSGFIDSWSNPPNQPSGTSHWVGCQAFHYRNSNTSGYGWQMVGGPIENLRFRSSWSGWRSWRTIPVLGVNSTNGAAMYASIYYDSNNTGYYCDPSSFSNLNSGLRATEIYARNWFRNDNSREGIYNQATGVHAYSYQGQYYAITGNNNSSSMSLQLRATYNGTMCRWMYGDRTWSGDLNAAGQWQLQTRHQDGYSPTLRFIESSNETWTGNIGNDGGKLEYHSNRFYLEAGGNSNRIVQFRRNGSNRSYIDNNGLYVGTATSARWADVAERYTADAPYEPGQVLGINLDGDSEVTLYQPGMPLAGAVSTKPGVRMNDMGIENDKSKRSKMNPFVALKGRIPVHVNGDVKKGQWVIADRDGKGKGVDYGTPGINTFDIIGIALSDSKDGEVEVKV